MVKNPPANAGDIRDVGLTPGSQRSPGGGPGNPLQYSCLENPRDSGAWWAALYGVAQTWTRLKQLSSSSSSSSSMVYPVVINGCEGWTIKKAAAAAKLLQSCPTLCDPIDGSPPGSPIPGILQARTLEWVAISSSNA